MITQKLCSKCEIEKPVSEFHKRPDRKSGLKSQCRSCCKKSAKKHYEKNKETILKHNMIYREENKEQLAKQKQIYRSNNKEQIQKSQRTCYQNNREARIERMREHYKINKKELLKQKREYWEANKKELNKQQRQQRIINPEKFRNWGRKAKRKRRALKLNAPIENFSHIEVFERDNYICQLCGRKTRPDYKNYNHAKYPNLDHIIPLSKGGGHTKLNTQCVCHQCNMQKNNKINFGDQLRLFG